MKTLIPVVVALWSGVVPLDGRGKKTAPPESLQNWLDETAARYNQPRTQVTTPGSLYSSNAILGDLSQDYRASRLDDIITIIVSDSASAVSKGASSASRKSSTKYGISALAGQTRATSAAANLAATSGNMQLDGQGQTTRQNTLTTTLSARVVQVLPNGQLVIAGSKNVTVNSEHQLVLVRGVVRAADLSPTNTIASNRVADLEISVQGKGIVGDAIRRPFFLYRLLMGILPL